MTGQQQLITGNIRAFKKIFKGQFEFAVKTYY